MGNCCGKGAVPRDDDKLPYGDDKPNKKEASLFIDISAINRFRYRVGKHSNNSPGNINHISEFSIIFTYLL